VGLLTLPLVYLLARRLFGLRVGLIALGLMAVSHWYNAYARLGINYNQTTLLEVAAVLAFWEGWQRRRAWWFVVSGLLTGAGLYLYFASRLTPVLLVAFAAYLWWWRRRARSQSEPVLSPRLTDMALWAATTVLVFLPMVPYFIAHSQELNSRADFVFLFNDSAKMNTFTGASEVLPALAVQVERYATLFNVGGDRSGQYGNTLPLIEYYTAAFFLLGLAYALYHARQPRYMLLLLWLSLTVFIGGVLTIESPFTPRIVGAMPVPFMLAAVALDRAWTRLGMHLTHPRREWAMRAVAVALAAAVITNNLWSYFGHYIHSIDGWAQREPATLVAQYAAQMTDDQKMYLLGAPELYIGHGTIRFLAPSLRGDDLLYPDAELPVRDPLARRAVFVVLPNYLEFVERLQALYPHGQIKEFRRPWGELQFVIYEAPAEDIERWAR
ncbi:MAG: glycosyltransferase family 39 protein, partial [Chloroflexi bacterium]|nr:glycosyltransferase family 39 protein [Chloroflexota bacterium]